MAVFQYTAMDKKREEYVEKGTVVARNEEEARQKLKYLHLEASRLKKLGGLQGFIRGLTADIK